MPVKMVDPSLLSISFLKWMENYDVNLRFEIRTWFGVKHGL